MHIPVPLCYITLWYLTNLENACLVQGSGGGGALVYEALSGVFCGGVIYED